MQEATLQGIHKRFLNLELALFVLSCSKERITLVEDKLLNNLITVLSFYWHFIVHNIRTHLLWWHTYILFF